MHSLVTEGDRSSVLYYLCSCDEKAFGRCTELLKKLVTTYKSEYSHRSIGRSLDSLHLDLALLPESTSWRRFAARKKYVYRYVFAHSGVHSGVDEYVVDPGASEDLLLRDSDDKKGEDRPSL
jgi:hypothetical protein